MKMLIFETSTEESSLKKRKIVSSSNCPDRSRSPAIRAKKGLKSPLQQPTLKLACLTLFLMLIAFTEASQARAESLILYSARYYQKSPSQITHFHLYSIKPDGSGKRQLTKGSGDDTNPIVSPDGKQVLFTRTLSQKTSDQTQESETAMLLTLDSGVERKLLRLKLGETMYDTLWNPDSKSVYVKHTSIGTDGSDKRYRRFGLNGEALGAIEETETLSFSASGKASLQTDLKEKTFVVDMKTSRKTALPEWALHPTWILGDRIVSGVQNSKGELALFDESGKELKRVKLDLATFPKDEEDSLVTLYLPIPGDESSIVFGSYHHDSTTGTHYDFYSANLTTGKIGSLLTSQNMKWSSKGDRFLSVPSRDLQSIGKNRSVWVAPLSLCDARGKEIKRLTPSLVWLGGCDWIK